ncbi:MAG: di-heme oxidoredictase family protein [Myxococcota bacterium]|nr:di-heme oxidoredictase family protein [Myxococcota bacterium]
MTLRTKKPILFAPLACALALTGCPGPEPEVPDDIFGEMGEVAPWATAEQRATFERGREVAQRRFSPEDGLGPHFNVSFCGGCHERPVLGGGGPRYRNFLLIQNELPDGTVQPVGVEGIQPQYLIESGRHETPEGADIVATRNAIPFFGAGLLAEIPAESIERHADPDDADGDGISGRPNYDQGFVGRFGRKSQTVSVEGFIRGPLFNHLGITSDPLPNELKAQLPVPSQSSDVGGTREGLSEGVGAVVAGQAAAPDSPITDDDGVMDPELAEGDLFDVVSFSMLLAVPRPDPLTPETEAGLERFRELGCDGCHVETLESPRGLIPLYSDLLLHDMGEALADGIRMGVATGSEFRTQPLWGIAPVGPFLHDGRADTLDEAIRLHGGEAQRVTDAYVALSDAERAEVIAFLESLGGGSLRSDGLIPPDEAAPTGEAYGAALPGTDPDAFEVGRRMFDRDFGLGAGLGPGFNGDSCRACHFDPVVGGAGPIDLSVTRQAIFDGTSMTAPAMGTMAHRHHREAVRPAIDPDSNFFELRQTPSILGLGLIERIPEAVILANEDPDDLDGDGVRGRAHRLSDGRLGRLGWKADVPDLAEFARDAMFNELGVTLPDQEGLTFGGATDDDGVADPEITIEELEALTLFMSRLAPPPRRSTDAALEARGETVFAEVGCASCHRTLELEDGTPVALYSDLLLHDVFAEGARGIGSGDASGRELRTPPLWGISETAPYMHDGLASTLEDAIARHYGEADGAATAFTELSAEDREALLAFLRSL